MKKEQVEQLKACAKNIHEYLKTQIRHDGNFLPPPLIIEIAGHPSCGKSTVIGKLDTSLRRLGFKVGLIQEGAQAIRNIERSGPEYNRATALYSLNKLYDVYANTSLDIVIFERCVFDAVVWPEYWNSKSKLESREMVDLQNTYLSDAPKIDLAFFVVCDPVLAIKRESRVEAIDQNSGGTTNPKTIEILKNIFEKIYTCISNKFPQLHLIDTANLTEQEMIDTVTEMTLTKLAEKSIFALIKEARDKKEYRPVVMAMIINFEGKILFIQSAENSKTWYLPQGGIESEESGMKTLFRELEEEVGIPSEQLSNIQYVGSEDLNSEITRVDKRGYKLGKRYFVFFVKYSGTNNLSINKKEISSYAWVNPNNVSEILSTTRKDKGNLIKKFINIQNNS